MWWIVILTSSNPVSSENITCDGLLYTPEVGYEEKHATIYFDEQFEFLAEDISCILDGLEISCSKMIPVHPTNTTLHQICKSDKFINSISRLHITVTVTKALEIEEMCQNDAVLLHMKEIDSKWLGHIVTPRSDIIIPLQTIDGEPTTDSLMMVMETVAMLWGPVYFTPDKSKYKSMKLIVKALKNKLVIIPTLVVCMVFLVGVVGLVSFYAKRKKQAAEQKTLQKRKALLLAEWGNEHIEGAPVWNIEGEQIHEPAENVADGTQDEQSKPKPRKRVGSNEVMISDTERSLAMDE